MLVGDNSRTAEVSAARTRSSANLQLFGRDKPPADNGHRSIGASIVEWMNRLDDRSDKQLEEIRADDRAPRSKRLAAASLLRSSLQEFAKNGRPLAADDLDRILDRTHGKAVQRVEVTQQEKRDPDAVRLELLQLLGEHPELRAAMADNLVRALPDAGVPGDPPGTPNEGSDAGE
jgi:hypothetical protein